MIVTTARLLVHFCCLIVLLSTPKAFGEQRVSGYVKNYSVVQAEVDSQLIDLDTFYSSQFTGRLMWEHLSDSMAMQVHYEAGSQFNSVRIPTGAFTIERNNYRLTDIKSRLGGSRSKTVSVQNLDRFNIQFQFDRGDLTVGRQAVTFGSARIINPTDVFLPFDVRTLNTEYRVGIDAVRLQLPIGQLSELDFGYVLGENSDHSAAFARMKTNLVGNDIELTAMEFSEQQLIGLGIQSTLGSFGTWFEVAHVRGDDSYNRTSVGLDYGFNEDWFAMLEFHYNGAGARETSAYANQLNTSAYQSGGVFLLGETYLAPSLSWQISALTSASAQMILNLDDHSSFFSLGFDHSLSDNLYIGGNLYIFSGDEARTGFPLDPGSEYGNNPNQVIVNLRYYF